MTVVICFTQISMDCKSAWKELFQTE